MIPLDPLGGGRAAAAVNIIRQAEYLLPHSTRRREHIHAIGMVAAGLERRHDLPFRPNAEGVSLIQRCGREVQIVGFFVGLIFQRESSKPQINVSHPAGKSELHSRRGDDVDHACDPAVGTLGIESYGDDLSVAITAR
jgi:hypothetical protein